MDGKRKCKCNRKKVCDRWCATFGRSRCWRVRGPDLIVGKKRHRTRHTTAEINRCVGGKEGLGAFCFALLTFPSVSPYASDYRNIYTAVLLSIRKYEVRKI